MFVRELSLTDFRNYCTENVELDAGVSVFIGHNGQGKTNLVEAVEYLSSLGSHRVSQDSPLVRAGCDQAKITAKVQAGLTDPRMLTIEVEIRPGKSNIGRVNRAQMPKAKDILGVLRTVVFSPEDLAIVKGDPGDRRRFIDDLVTTRWPRMAGVRSDYDRILKQRNSLLKTIAGKSAREGEEDPELSLEIWSDQLAAIGGELLSARLDTLVEVMPHVLEAYGSIAPINNQTSASYKSTLDISGENNRLPNQTELTERLRTAMQQNMAEETRRGVSLVGPHRDDIILSIGELPAKGYASHGECWSLALALKLGGFALLKSDGIEPVLVLDDVFAELDEQRRLRLAAGVLDAEQVLVTCAVPTDIPESMNGKKYYVHAGSVSTNQPKGTTNNPDITR